jgi:hypothetical protein
MRDTGIPVANVVDPYPIRSEENVSISLLLPAVTGTGKKRIGYPSGPSRNLLIVNSTAILYCSIGPAIIGPEQYEIQ